MKFIKKNYLLILLIILTIFRFYISYNLPNYYFKNLGYDDTLMFELANNIYNGNYLGNYSSITLIKGFIFPLFISLFKLINLPFSLGITILYIVSCLFFTNSLKGIIKNNYLKILYLLLLFNPISYSMELFQRLYRNSLSIIETLFFFSFIIRIIKTDNLKKNIINYLLLGITTSIMYLTREDNIWCMIILILLFLYKFLKNNKTIKSFFYNLSPIIILFILLNIVSFINYKYYGLYTYNELSNSSFKDAYIKIQQIKDTKKINRVSITKESLQNLADVSKVFDITREDIDKFYENLADKDTNEINNAHIIWYLRHLIYSKKKFENAYDANLYFKNLANEIDELFKEGKLEKEFVIKSVFINTPSLNDLKIIPSNLLKIIEYTSSYKNVRSISLNELKQIPIIKYEENNNTYYTYYKDYNDTENLITKNIKSFEFIRIFYQYFTIIFSFICVIIYFINIKKIFNKNMFITTLILITYSIIILGVTITNTTGFHAIRYYYLGNVYILQTIFIILNLNGVKYERFRVNNFITLFKRRKNNRKMYTRS